MHHIIIQISNYSQYPYIIDLIIITTKLTTTTTKINLPIINDDNKKSDDYRIGHEYGKFIRLKKIVALIYNSRYFSRKRKTVNRKEKNNKKKDLQIISQ